MFANTYAANDGELDNEEKKLVHENVKDIIDERTKESGRGDNKTLYGDRYLKHLLDRSREIARAKRNAQRNDEYFDEYEERTKHLQNCGICQSTQCDSLAMTNIAPILFNPEIPSNEVMIKNLWYTIDPHGRLYLNDERGFPQEPWLGRLVFDQGQWYAIHAVSNEMVGPLIFPRRR